ncbi:hypothetical protein LCGC14_0374480 [marine sediment metagenome]|uniref:Uncharacterized protein n=1 Tax=marine sediment metagenome TaxID=412755 RepID=A0A0F9WCX6_9ZZZZ
MVDGITQEQIDVIQARVKTTPPKTTTKKQLKFKKSKRTSLGKIKLFKKPLINVAASDKLARELIRKPSGRFNLLTDVKVPPRKFDLIKGKLDESTQITNKKEMRFL